MKTKSFYTLRIINLIASDKFMAAILLLLVAQAAWIAGTGLYPLAFDEDFHFGLIKLYAEHGLPFWSEHPSDGDAFGALTRDPSYLFHYLMSFPYRLMTVFTDNQALQIMLLRTLNIGLFAACLPLYRRLLLRTGATRALVHLSLLVFVLVPIVPYLAAHINYDNLVLPLTALAMLWTLDLRSSMKRTKLNSRLLLQLVTLLMLTCLVKYAFLPFALAMAIFLLISAYKVYGRPHKLVAAFRAGARGVGKTALYGLTALILLTSILFAERFGVNLVRYHTPVADCAQVLNYDHCKHYGVWIRDYKLEKNKGNPDLSAMHFTVEWMQGMWFRSFFAIAGPTAGYQNGGPFVLPGIGAIVLAISSLSALLFTARQVWRRYNAPVLKLFTLVSIMYLLVLWLDVFQLYLKTGKPVAINGRYLLPVLPLVICMAALAVNRLLGHRRGLKLALATAVIICFAWGGGSMAYILRSNDTWYWPHTPLRSPNHFIRDNIGPAVPGYYNQHLGRP